MIDTESAYFLFHQTPSLDFVGTPLLLLSTKDSKLKVTSLEELSKIELPIITHSFSLLVDWFRIQNLSLPKIVVDLEMAKKLVVGRPKSDFEIEQPWDMASMLQRFVHPRYDARAIRAALTTHLAKPPISDFANLRWMTAIARGLRILWHEMLVELELKGELRRFLDVEVPTYNTMLASQYLGIRLDPQRRDSLLQVTKEDYVSSHYQLAIEKGIDVERALADVEYLNEHFIQPIQLSENFANAIDLIRARKDFDPICSLLDAVYAARRSRNILLRSVGNDPKQCYLTFDTMGTVTGRILAVDPRLQNLKKKYRNIIQARPGRKLVYVDYSQFEPNIMASISGDPQLLTLCRKGDLYEWMAIKLCNDIKYRKTGKVMFLAYSYGKQVATLSDLLAGIFSSKNKADAVVNEHFIPIFSGIEQWKTNVENKLVKYGHIETLFGNHRYRMKSGDLDPKERRWAISQVVQGTGSLILKKLINTLTNKLPEVSVLLPMHDALLVEVPEESSMEVAEELLNYCRQTFSEVCPLITPSVCEKSFYE